MATLSLLLLFQLSALGNLDVRRGAVTTALGDVLDLLDDVVALEDFAEDDVTAIQPPTTCQYCSFYQSPNQTHAVIAVVMKN